MSHLKLGAECVWVIVFYITLKLVLNNKNLERFYEENSGFRSYIGNKTLNQNSLFKCRSSTRLL